MSAIEKFRVFCEKHNKFEYYTLGDLVCGNTTSESNEGGTFKNWCQYTGLKDKNSVEIYEGDIVKILDEYVDVVDYECGCFVMKNQTQFYEFTYQNFNTIEVIGNIYDNPELLKNESEEIWKENLK